MSRIVEEKRICDRCKKELSLYPSFKIMQGKHGLKRLSASQRHVNSTEFSKYHHH